jgi:hypothetical protein
VHGKRAEISQAIGIKARLRAGFHPAATGRILRRTSRLEH